MKSTADTGLVKPLLYLALTVFLAAGTVFLFSDRQERQLPQEIFGEWYSDDPRYQTCFVTISADSFVIGGADGNTYHYALKSVEEEASENGAGRFYTLLCEDEEGLELEFRIHYDAATGMLSYRNQRDVIWLKAKKEY
ncbi:hypothetical protein ACUUL3_11875 [Thiovibrio sp. JS02]